MSFLFKLLAVWPLTSLKRNTHANTAHLQNKLFCIETYMISVTSFVTHRPCTHAKSLNWLKQQLILPGINNTDLEKLEEELYKANAMYSY